MKHMFLEKFFPASRIVTIRKEICRIRQQSGESLDELCATCLHHQISEQLPIQYFYEGLMMMDRSMINATSGGALMDKMPTTARQLILSMASNTQQFKTRGAGPSRAVNEAGIIDNLRFENQLTQLTSLVRQLAIVQQQQNKLVCGPKIRIRAGHVDFESAQLSTPMSKIPSPIPTSTTTTTTIRRVDVISTKPERHDARFKNANWTTSQFNESVTVDWFWQSSLINHSKSKRRECECRDAKKPTDAESKPEADSPIQQSARLVPLPFPTRTPLARKSKMDKDLLKMFRKVPKYAKFLKELCIHKRKKIKGGVETRGILSGLAQNEGATARSQLVLPKKYGDPRIFSIQCTIGECTFTDAMLDQGASFNVMPTLVYKSLNFGVLEPMGMTIQIANRSVIQPLGIFEDVLVQVNDLIFPADFYVLDMEDETSGKGSA
ncbi:hypothetical protein CR513_03729, partial [Mucuna pruriens]